jgi:hypothetical protein
MRSPLNWDATDDWKIDYCNPELLTPEELIRRRAEFDRGKAAARTIRGAG